MKQVRAIWPLLKARVTSIEGGRVVIHLGGTTNITVPLPHENLYDIREGDLLTLYTEVLLRAH